MASSKEKPKAAYGEIISVRFWVPTQDRELEVRLETKKYKDSDAVFTSVKAVTNILIPFYKKTDPDVAEALKSQVEKQQLGGVCFVLHKWPCSREVPPIDWNAPSPITL
jgi:hypothetical protein